MQETFLSEYHKRGYFNQCTNESGLTNLMTKQHYESDAEMRRLRMDITERVGTLEKWKYLIIGGSIVVGFIISSYMRYFM